MYLNLHRFISTGATQIDLAVKIESMIKRKFESLFVIEFLQYLKKEICITQYIMFTFSFSSDMEMHIVFYNTKYGSFEEATSEYQKQKDALVVLGVFINVRRNPFIVNNHIKNFIF